MYLLLSLVAHAAIFYFLLPTESREIPPIEIELKEVTKPTSPPPRPAGIAMNRLVPQLKLGSHPERGDTSETNGSTIPGDDPTSEWGTGSADINRIADYLPIDRIRIQTDGLTYYPYVLAKNGVNGGVNARLVLKDGSCNWKRTRIWAADRHLKIYVLSVLKKLCRMSDIERYARGSQVRNIDFTFAFEFTEGQAESKSYVRGNVIAIHRFQARSILEYRIGPIRGIFPIPYVALDFDWLQENWDQMVLGKPDPFENYVAEKTRELE